MARLEMGEVLLTTRLSDVFLHFGQPVLPGNITLAEFNAESVVIQACKPGRLGESHPALGVVAAGQFNLHVPLAFAGPEGQTCKHGLVEFQSDAHDELIAALSARVKVDGAGRGWSQCRRGNRTWLEKGAAAPSALRLKYLRPAANAA